MNVTAYLNLNFDDDVPFPDRVDQAAAAGVDGIEFYGWDLGTTTGQSATFASGGAELDVDAVVDRIEAHDLDLVYMSGDRPPLTDPALADEALTSIERSLELADQYGCRAVNIKTGPVQVGISREVQRQTIIDTLRRAAPAAEAADAMVVLEPLNPLEAPDHFIHTVAEGCALIDAVDSPSIRVLFDIYHEQLSRGNLVNTISDTLETYAGHVHVADPPDRTQPGTGEINWDRVFETIAQTDYDGYIGGEFRAKGDTVEALETLVDLADQY